MSTVLVTGGTGTLGRALVPVLAARGHDVRVLSRVPGRGTHVGDLATGAGVAAAADGAELVVHAASSQRLRTPDELLTRRLLAAVPGCAHLVYVSIVGVDVIPFRYYRSKLACEQMIAASPVPSTTLRATQFHELLAGALGVASRWPVTALPLAWRFQSVAAAEVATRVADVLQAGPRGRAPDFGGPQALTGRQVTDTWREHRGGPRVVLSLRWPGAVYQAFADGLNTCPEHADGHQTWAEHVRRANSGDHAPRSRLLQLRAIISLRCPCRSGSPRQAGETSRSLCWWKPQ